MSNDKDTRTKLTSGKYFIKIPNDMFMKKEIEEYVFYLTIFYYVLMNENRCGLSKFSLSEILYDVLGYKENRKKPMSALNKIIKSLYRMQEEGYVELISDIESVKLSEIIYTKIKRRPNPENNYVELYWNEFNAIVQLFKCYSDEINISISSTFRFYLYIKNRTYNGTRDCVQSSESIGSDLGYSKQTSNSCVKILLNESNIYTALITRDIHYEGGNRANVSYKLNSKFDLKNK